MGNLDHHGDGGAHPHGGLDVHLIAVFLHVGQAHARAEAQVPGHLAGGGVAGLHSLVDVGDTRALVGQGDGDVAQADVHRGGAAVGVDDHVDLPFIHTHRHPADSIWVKAQLAQGLLDLGGTFINLVKVLTTRHWWMNTMNI